MTNELNLVGIINEVHAGSTFSFGDTNSDTETAIFILKFNLSKKDKKEGYNLKQLYLYDSPVLSHAFPKDPMDRLCGDKLEGICENSIIVINGPLYCEDIQDFDGWSDYPLSDESTPFPYSPNKQVFGTPFHYPSVVPKVIPSLKEVKFANGFLGSAFLLNESSACDDYQKLIIEDLRKYGIEMIKKEYFDSLNSELNR
jgi:hypothetical protein